MRTSNVQRSAATAVALTFALAACGGQGSDDEASRMTHHVSVAAPDFASVKDLAGNSALYVRGTVGAVISTETDNGGVEDNAPDLPVKFVELQVAETSDPALIPIGKTVPIVWSDLRSAVELEEQDSDLVAGTEVLVFANPLTSTEAPGIDTVEFFLSPVGGENGVFDVQAGIASARSQMLASLTQPQTGPRKSGRFEAPVDNVVDIASAVLR